MRKIHIISDYLAFGTIAGFFIVLLCEVWIPGFPCAKVLVTLALLFGLSAFLYFCVKTDKAK